MLGFCMGGAKGCSGEALRTADMLALQDHSCATDGHLQQKVDYIAPLVLLFYS